MILLYILQNPGSRYSMENSFETTNDLPIHQKIYQKLDYYLVSNKIPHIIFHGSSGSGKRTIVDKFLNKIYQNDKTKLKSNVMFVNCAHGKGIKFIREELKFFAKTNIQSNNGMIFKTIVLLNADFLTIDAQSALRRCIELFSFNTRFFIIVENKQKLLNPILSRFCEIYVPEYIPTNSIENKITNLHQYSISKSYSFDNENIHTWVDEKMKDIDNRKQEITHEDFTKLANEFYEKGASCLDLIHWIENTLLIEPLNKSLICMCFDKIKSEFRCEKLLLLYIFDFIYLRSNNDLKNISKI